MRRSLPVVVTVAVTLAMPVAQAAAKTPSLTHNAAMKYAQRVYFPALIKLIEDPARPFVDGHVTEFKSGTFRCRKVVRHKRTTCLFTMHLRATSTQDAADVTAFTCKGAVAVGYGLHGHRSSRLSGQLLKFKCRLDGGSGANAGPPSPDGSPAPPPGGPPPPPPGS